MEGDEIFRRGGVDVFVFGHARVPQGLEAIQSEVSIEIGRLRRTIAVFGDRVWTQGNNGLVPSTPRPFRAIPLTLQYAFGGKSEWDGLSVPYADNPEGKGFYLEEEQALGQPLPNLEDPNQFILKWDDRPSPAGVAQCPMANRRRLQQGVEVDENGGLKRIDNKLFNAAFPEMIVDSTCAGEIVRVDGVSETGPISFRIPAFDLVFRLTFDSEIIERRLTIDQLGIEPDRQRAFITYRYPFRYVLYPLQRRTAELFTAQLQEEATWASMS
jgi:hypothetical protein